MKDTQKAGAEQRMSRSRYTELRKMLEDRRRQIQAEVQGKMRGVREEGSWGGKLNEVVDAVESAEADIQEDIEFALVQMKSETLNKINDALTRLEHGDYGFCFDCGEEIAEKRLRALPKRRARTPNGASGSSPLAAAPRRCSSTCNTPFRSRIADGDSRPSAVPIRGRRSRSAIPTRQSAIQKGSPI